MAGEQVFSPEMSDADALMWTIEGDPALRTTITAVAALDRIPDWGELVRRADDATVRIPRLRERVVPRPVYRGTPRWVADPDFDLEYHVRRIAAPAPGDLRAVLDVAAPWAAAGFDRHRPLWELTIVEGMGDGRAAFVLKVHHSLTDGVGGIELANLLFDVEREPPTGRRRPAAAGGVAGPRAGRGLADRLGRVGEQTVRDGVALARASARVASDPVGSARQGADLARSLTRLLAPAPEPRSPLMRGRSLAWRFDALSVPLADVKAAAKAAGGTLNDVFLAATAGALQRYHGRHGVAVDRLRMEMPVSIRGPEDDLAGNRFVPARFDLPMIDGDPARRVQEAGRVARAWRDDPALRLTDSLAALLTRLPPDLTTRIFGSMQKGVDFVATNIPGVPVPVYLAGAEVTRLYPFGPTSGSALSVALLSHVDTCCIGLNVDRAAVPDHELLRDCLEESFEELARFGRRRPRARKP